jgi:hypothetical protein
VITEPYSRDDDDPPTLQRAAPLSSPARPAAQAPRLPAERISGSGIHAVRLPQAKEEELLDSALLEEVETDLSRHILPSEDELCDPTEVSLPSGAVPADSEMDTPCVPVDMAMILRLASIGTERLPSPLGDDTEDANS